MFHLTTFKGSKIIVTTSRNNNSYKTSLYESKHFLFLLFLGISSNFLDVNIIKTLEEIYEDFIFIWYFHFIMIILIDPMSFLIMYFLI